jgi:hypothetical protein
MRFISWLTLAVLCSVPICIFLTHFIVGFYKLAEQNWLRIFLLSTAASTILMLLFLKLSN